MGKWTKEPWCVALAPYDEDEIEITTEDRERQSVIPICLVKVGYKGAVEDEQRANIPRMIECVNALAGIPDPAATMNEVVEVLERIRVMVDSEKQRELAAALLAKLGRG